MTLLVSLSMLPANSGGWDAALQTPNSAALKSEFIFDKAPFAQCHASTIAETRGGLVAAWFGGTAEGRPDVGIWLARRDGGHWSAPVKVATGTQEDGSRLPCWNPVLHQANKGLLLLFYKVGPSPSRWWGMMIASADGGRTWTPPAPTELPNPNSGIDAMTLRDRRHILVYNPVERGRSRLSVAVSDDAVRWTPILVLEDEPGQEFSYPAVTQAGDGSVHIAYTWKRQRIKHVVLDPAGLIPEKDSDRHRKWGADILRPPSEKGGIA